MSLTLGWPRLPGLLAVPLLMATACGSNVDEVSDVVLARHVHTDLYDAYPGIPSPDGDRVVFADFAADARALAVYDVATGIGRAVTRTPAGRTRVTWSPDGSRVVYVDRWPQSHGVWTLDPTTGEESRIAPSRDQPPPDIRPGKHQSGPGPIPRERSMSERILDPPPAGRDR